jgi:glucose/arabinose dehydrogenase
VRDVEEGPDGLIYLVTDETQGGLYRIEPAS